MTPLPYSGPMSGPVLSSGSQSALREANSARLIDAVRRFGGITQVELAQATGLSPATVSTIVKTLSERGTVETRTTTRSGRRAQLVTLAHRPGLLAGLEVTPRGLRVIVADSGFEVLTDRVLPLPPDPRLDTTLDRAALFVVELVDDLGEALGDVQGIGLGLPVPVHPETGRVTVRGLLPGWEDVDIADVLRARLERPVVVDNDANLAALAEARFGAGRGERDLLYVHASYGTGAGLLIGGDLHRGSDGTAGEIGHVLVDPQGPVCRCGSRGCLDTRAGVASLLESLRASRGPRTLPDLLRATQEGDPGSRQVVEDAGAAIGAVVANLAVGLDPGLVVVGGELAGAGDVLLDPIRAALGRRTMLGAGEPVRVSAGQLAGRAASMGALALTAERTQVTGSTS